MANTPIIGRWRKQPSEELRYEVDWSEWALPGETLLEAFLFVVENTTEYPLEISEPYFTDNKLSCVFYVRGGKNQSDYQVTHRVSTSIGQIAEREIVYMVEEV